VFEDITKDVKVNLELLCKVLENCKSNNITFNFISSWFVYGKTKNLPVNESQPCDPKGFYSITKRAAEQMLISFCQTYGLNYRIIRLCNVIGKGDLKASRKKNALQHMIDNLKQGEDVSLYDGGTHIREYMHVDDVCSAINLIIEKGNLNDIYNVSLSNPTTIGDMILYAKEKIASKSKIKEIEVFTELSKSYITWKDSLSNVHSEYDSVDFKRSAVLYELGELEAFHFQNPNEGLKYFIQLLDFFPESSKVPQALYSISYIHDKNNDTVKSDKIKKKLITKYPQTIYSEAILKSNDEFILERSIFEKKLVEAEKSMNVDENASILKYTNIALADTISNANMIAIFFLANYYDFNRSNPDSALKYYSMTQNSYPKTKQAEFSKLRISNINSILSDSLSINMYNIIEN